MHPNFKRKEKEEKMTQEIYFTSDTHYGHGNIIKYSARPFMDQFEQHEYDKAKANLTPDQFRDFDRKFKISRESVQRMDETMIANHNAKVPKNATVYFVGDVSFHNDVRHTVSILNRLNGIKHLITGNHDKGDLREESFRKCFASIRDISEIKHEGQSIVLCHYAMRVWNKSHRGAWHLYGHSHGSLPDDPNSLSIDVGVDCHNFTPISFSEVKAIMAKKNYKAIDHHGADL